MDLSKGDIDLSDGKEYPLDGSEIPFPDLDSILALLPTYAQGDDVGAMRNAVLNTLAAVANKVWADTGILLNAFISPRYAEGRMLDDVWGVALKKARIADEDDAHYRLRLLTPDAVITPNAIKNAVKAAADFFNASVATQEPASDGLFLSADDPSGQDWGGWLQPDDGILWSTDPESRCPTPGAFLADDHPGATGIVIMDRTAGSDDVALVLCADDDTTSDANCFLSDGTVDWGFFTFDGDPLELRIVREVEARRAFSIRWMLIETPYLSGAH